MNDAFGHPQSVVVLGGTSDIGTAVVTALVGARTRRVVLAGRDATALERTAAAVGRAGAEQVDSVVFEAGDVAGAAGAVGRSFEAAGGPVDMVLITVGALGDQEGDETDPGRVADALTVNFTWPAAAICAAAERLRAQGSGRLVVLSSVAGVRVRRANYLYGSAKAGLDAYTTGVAEAMRADPSSGVLVQVVRPGFVHSKMTEGRPAAPFATTPAAVAAAVVRGIETNQPVVWAPPVLRWVFGVFRLLPQTIWRRLPG